jgi:hypothetical protein
MYACSSCGRKSLRFPAKVWSWAALPAECRECKTLCFAPGSPGGLLLVLNALLLTLAGFAGIFWHSPIPVLVGVAVAVTVWVLRLHVQPFIALSPEQTAAARKREGFWLFAFVLFSWLQ